MASKNWKNGFALFPLIAASLIASCDAPVTSPDGADDAERADLSYSDELWQALRQARLAGDDAIHARPYEGTEPHGAVLQTLTARLTVRGHDGQVIVKRNYGPAGITLPQVWASPGDHLAAVTVMFQREAGFDAAHGNWYWAKFKPDGSLETNEAGEPLGGSVPGCIDCHRKAQGDDFIYAND